MNFVGLKTKRFYAIPLVLSQIVFAQTRDKKPSVPFQPDEPLLLLMHRFHASSKTARLNLAHEIRNHVANLLAYVPTPKPSETMWIDGEIAEVNKITDPKAAGDRLEKLYETPEWQQRHLREGLQEIIEALDGVSKQNISIQTEVLHWSMAAQGLTNNEEMNDAITKLKGSGRLAGDLSNSEDSVIAVDGGKYPILFGAYGRAIQDQIVIPYLGGRIKK